MHLFFPSGSTAVFAHVDAMELRHFYLVIIKFALKATRKSRAPTNAVAGFH